MSDETFLHSQLQEGLSFELMEAPAVSGSHTYRELGEETGLVGKAQTVPWEHCPVESTTLYHTPRSPSSAVNYPGPGVATNVVTLATSPGIAPSGSTLLSVNGDQARVQGRIIFRVRSWSNKGSKKGTHGFPTVIRL